MRVSLVVSCMLVIMLGFGSVRMSHAAGQDAQPTAGEPQVYSGLEIAAASVERAPSAPLRDCPPGANTVKAMTRPGEEFAIVHVNFKVLPDFKPIMLDRPTLEAADGETYRTAMSFVDVGKVPEFSCGFPFRVKEGTKVKNLKINTVTLDLGELDTPEE